MDQKPHQGIEDYEINKDKKTVVYKRYYHVFKKGELEELLAEMTGFKIVQQYYGKQVHHLTHRSCQLGGSTLERLIW